MNPAAVLGLIALMIDAGGAPPPAAAGQDWRLANGLQVVVLPRPGTPVVAVHVAYHVGSKDEPAGRRGIAHLFEHLMFKGSQAVAPEQHANLVKAVGGRSNAVTGEDITVFQNSVPAGQLDLVLRLEADRMRRLRLRPEALSTERQVVLQERALRVDDDPMGRGIELLRARLFSAVGDAYGWLPIGQRADLQALTLADCQRFYDAHYRPDGAALVIVGDVDPAIARRLVDVHFGPLAAGAAGGPAAPPPMPAPAVGLADQVVEASMELPLLVGGYGLPAVGDDEHAALRVLASLFAGGESSRLHGRLVRRQRVALSAGGQLQSFQRGALLMFMVAPADPGGGAGIRAIVAQEARRLQRHAVSGRELAKAKNQLAFDWLEATESAEGLADELVRALFLEADWRRLHRQVPGILAVTAADVQRVARRHLRDANLATVLLRPRATGAATAALPASRRQAGAPP